MTPEEQIQKLTAENERMKAWMQKQLASRSEDMGYHGGYGFNVKERLQEIIEGKI